MNHKLTIKWLLGTAVFWGCIFTTPNSAACSEKYYVNNTRVLLYKIINWWYDSLPEESYRICGNLIKCRSEGNIQINYDAGKMKIWLSTKESFADLLSVFRPCEQCRGPSHLKLTRLNKKYFGDGKYMTPTDRHTILDSYIFSQIESSYAGHIRSIADDIGLEMEGVICGLMNGKIALHHSGELIKACPADKKKQDEQFPIVLKIVNFQTKELLAEFSVIFDDKNCASGVTH